MTKTDYFERKLDDKNRLTIPADVRSEFPSREVVITRGFGQYLHLYSQEVWNEKVEPALAGDILSEDVADKNVKLRTGKVAATLDSKQGRITIEQHLLDFADIDKEVVVVRAGEYWRVEAKEKTE